MTGTTGELAAWLRGQVKADLAAARIIGAGGFAPQRWDTNPPGQVNPEALPVTDEINTALLPDPEDREFREYLPGWVEVVSYDRLNNEPPEADCRDDDLPVLLVQDGRRQFEHVIRQDPRSTAARCEAELAILDACDQAWRHARDYGATERNTSQAEAITQAQVWSRAVRILGTGYAHRPGYREEWAP